MDVAAIQEQLASARVDTPVQETVDQLEIIIDKGVEEKKPEIVDADPDSDLNSVDGLIKYAATELGYDGEIEGTDFDAVLGIAKKQIEKYKTIAEDQRVTDFLEHLDKGGSKETFQQMQPTNIYGDIVLDENDTELTEDIVKEVLVVLRNFDDEEDVEEFIDNLKDKGELYKFAEKNLPKLQQKEKEVNETKKQKIEAQLADSKAESNKYYGEIKSAFTGGKLIGIKPDSNWKEVEKLSIPDEKGKLGIDDILNNLNTTEVATMNYFAYCLKNNKSFEFRPKGVVADKPIKPIHEIFDKGKIDGKTQQGQGSFGNALMGKLKNN